MSEPSYRILVVCTGNICRSPIGEGILRDLLPVELLSRTEVLSAGVGTGPGHPPSPHSVTVCEEHGIDISDQRSLPVTAELLSECDLVLCMEEHHRMACARVGPAAAGHIHLLSRYAAGDGTAPPHGVPDPIGGDLDEYRDAYRRIDAYIRQALPRIEAEILARTVES